jgi:hypothetical protein
LGEISSLAGFDFVAGMRTTHAPSLARYAVRIAVKLGLNHHAQHRRGATWEMGFAHLFSANFVSLTW